MLAPGGAERWLVARACASRDRTGRVSRLLGTLVDVTERRRNEDERRQLLEKLGHAQRMEAIGRLAAGVAHDFNNHLTIVHAAAELLLGEPGLSADGRESVSSIQSAAGSAGALTKQLLAFGRERQARERPVPTGPQSRHSQGLQRLLPDGV